MRLKIKLNDYGKEAKSIGDCGEDCSSCTHGIPHCVGNNQLHEALVTGSRFKVQEFKREAPALVWGESLCPLGTLII